MEQVREWAETHKTKDLSTASGFVVAAVDC